METEQLEKDLADNKTDTRMAEGSVPADTLPSKQDQMDVNSGKKGTLETKNTCSQEKNLIKGEHLNAASVSSQNRLFKS